MCLLGDHFREFKVRVVGFFCGTEFILITQYHTVLSAREAPLQSACHALYNTIHKELPPQEVTNVKFSRDSTETHAPHRCKFAFSKGAAPWKDGVRQLLHPLDESNVYMLGLQCLGEVFSAAEHMIHDVLV